MSAFAFKNTCTLRIGSLHSTVNVLKSCDSISLVQDLCLKYIRTCTYGFIFKFSMQTINATSFLNDFLFFNLKTSGLKKSYDRFFCLQFLAGKYCKVS